MRIAVTGASGHIGINLVKKLVSEGHYVRVLVHRNDKLLRNLDVDIFTGDITDESLIEGFCKDIQVVFHLAAVISIVSDIKNDIISTNVSGTRNLVNQAKKEGVSRFIYFSSVHAYDHKPYNAPMSEQNNLLVNSKIPYEQSKAVADRWVISQQGDNFDVMVLCPTAVIGPEDHGPSLMGRFIKMACNNRIVFLVPGGYDWIDVRDIVNASLNALINGRGGHRYFLSGKWMSVKNLSCLISDLNRKKTMFINIPYWLAKTGVQFMKLYSIIFGSDQLYSNRSLTILQYCNTRISSQKAKNELNFMSRPIEETVVDTVEWFNK